MIGGGGKIGGPGGPGPINIPTTEPPQQTGDAGAAKGPVTQPPTDHFEKAGGRPGGPNQGAIAGERGSTADVLKLARDNPAQAKQLVATLRGQIDKNLAKVQQELAGAQAALQQLGAQRFSKKALQDKREELRRRRDKIASMKMRLLLTNRKMALLQQLAGKLGDPGLEEELDRILSHHEKLHSDWGKRHHLLSIGEALFGADEDTPDHLRDVIKAEVRSGFFGNEVGDALHEVSPRRVIAEIIARTLDGSVLEGRSHEQGEVGRRGEHGSTLKHWSALGDVMVAALGREAFGKSKEP